MRYILYFLFPILSFSSLAQLQSSCTGVPLLAQTYDKDIADLAVQRIFDLQSPDTALIDIPQGYIDTITKGLYAIYNLSATIEADSVYRMHCIHIYPGYEKNKDLMVHVDPNATWTNAWKSLQTVTGYTSLDSLLNKYGYTVTDFYSHSSLNAAVLHTDQLINTTAFGKQLENFSGIYKVEPTISGGDGDFIYYKRDTIGHFNFTLAWGDCPSGCMSRKTWQYLVDDNCNVTFLGTQQIAWTPWPKPLNCNLFKVEVDPLTVINPNPEMWPNPVTNELHFYNYKDYSYNLFDMRKRRVAAANAIQRTHTLDMSGLASGVYLLQMRGPTGNSFVRKIIKL